MYISTHVTCMYIFAIFFIKNILKKERVAIEPSSSQRLMATPMAAKEAPPPATCGQALDTSVM